MGVSMITFGTILEAKVSEQPIHLVVRDVYEQDAIRYCEVQNVRTKDVTYLTFAEISQWYDIVTGQEEVGRILFCETD